LKKRLVQAEKKTQKTIRRRNSAFLLSHGCDPACEEALTGMDAVPGRFLLKVFFLSVFIRGLIFESNF
jgi:hypothetical protein